MACSGWKRDDPSLSASPCKRPMRCIRSACCALAASGHAAAAPPSTTSNSRRPMVTVIRPSRARCVKGRIPRHERAVPNSAAPRGGRGTGAHLWADRFEGSLDDIFSLQDQITTSVIGAIAPKLEQAEIERAKRKPTESLDAYDYFLRGMAALHHGTQDANDEALRLFYKAIELDPEFASAYGMAAYCYVWRKSNGWMVDSERETAEAVRLALRATELGKDDAVALCWGGFALVRAAGDLDNGIAFLDRAIAINPNLAAAWGFGGRARVYRGE